MNFNECMTYIHKTAWLGSKPGLKRIGELLGLIGNPQRALKFIHIVGTNGKGSVSAMLTSVLVKAGYRVGTFTSPYIVCFNERIQLNGIPITDDELAETVGKIKPFADKMTDPPTEFEIVTAVGFEYFAASGCDIVVLEAGMGGALDSTNIIDAPEAAVFTSIGIDHKAQLGGTVAEIALTKAGILKEGTTAVFYGEEKEALPVLQSECRRMDIPLIIPDRVRLTVHSCSINGSTFDYRRLLNVSVNLLGIHQVYNAITVLETISVLNEKGFNIGERAIKSGLENIRWPARFEVLKRMPTVIFDGAHNVNGVNVLAENVGRFFPEKRIKILMGVMADKEYGRMLDIMMPFAESFYAVTPDNPRALSADRLSAEASLYGVKSEVLDLKDDSLTRLINSLAAEDVLLIMGSLYMYGDIIKTLL